MVTDERLDMFMGDVWKPSIRERLIAKQEFNNSLDNFACQCGNYSQL